MVHTERKFDRNRKLFLRVAAVILVAWLITFGLVDSTQVRAQSAPAIPAINIAATWQGTLHANRDLRFILKFTKSADGTLRAIRPLMSPPSSQAVLMNAGRDMTFEAGAFRSFTLL